MKVIALPDASAPAAKKIDYVGKRLAQLLAPYQFERTSRRFHRVLTSGRAVDAVQVFNLQGSQWNQGTEGRFCINVGIHYPPLAKTLARYKAWAPREKLAPHECHFDLRIDKIVPRKRERWWPAELKPGRDSWFSVGPKLDLATLGDSLCLVVETLLVPWFAARGSIEALALGLPPCDDAQRAIALHLLGRKPEARAHFAASKMKDPQIEAWLKR